MRTMPTARQTRVPQKKQTASLFPLCDAIRCPRLDKHDKHDKKYRRTADLPLRDDSHGAWQGGLQGRASGGDDERVGARVDALVVVCPDLEPPPLPPPARQATEPTGFAKNNKIQRSGKHKVRNDGGICFGIPGCTRR